MKRLIWLLSLVTIRLQHSAGFLKSPERWKDNLPGGGVSAQAKKQESGGTDGARSHGDLSTPSRPDPLLGGSLNTVIRVESMTLFPLDPTF